MERLNGHDELLSRITAVDPAARVAPMTEGALERVSRHAMTPMPKTWTWRRFQFASLGALVGSGGLVIAGILGIQSAAQNLPIIALGSTHNASPTKPGASKQGFGAMMIPFETFNFTADPSLSSSPGSGTAYVLSSSIDAATAASQIARKLGVSGDVTSLGGGSYQVGPDNGPDVSTYTSNGIVNWYFSATTPTVITSPGGTTTAPTDPTGPLPTNDQAVKDAMTLFETTLGVSNDLGTPSVSNYGTEVDVTIPIVVDGLSTDQSLYVSYGPSEAINSVSGEFVTATAQSTYPTISQTDAVNVVIAHNGFVFCGGIMPMGVAPSSGASNPPGSSSGSAPGGAPSSGPVGDASPPVTPPTDTTPPTDPPTTIPEPVINVDINQATMQLATYSLTDGTSWLLPSWALSGPETGTTVSPGGTYTANVIAVDSQYVQLQACPMVY
jgi:hypothetical protein